MKHCPPLLLCILLLLTSFVVAQTPTCGEDDYQCKIDSYTAAIKANPQNAENYFQLSVAYRGIGAYKESIEAMTKYVSSPGLSSAFLADGYNRRGLTYADYNQPQLALADYTKAITLTPNSVYAYINRANTYIFLKNYDAALADYNSAGAKDPKYAEPFYGRARVYVMKSLYAKAIAEVDKYISMIVDKVYIGDAYYIRGMANSELGNLQPAVIDLTKAIDGNPTERAYRRRATVYRKQNKIALAEADEKMAASLAAQ